MTSNGYDDLGVELGSRCNHTVRLAGYYFIFVITLGHIFLTMR